MRDRPARLFQESCMSGSLHETPRSGRLHLGFFGRRNAGKSSLVNAVAGHEAAIVSDVAGTTTDPVFKSMEIHGLGPCVLADTAGFDDDGVVGGKRVAKTVDTLEKTDVALLVVAADASEDGPEDGFSLEKEWAARLRERKTPFLLLVNKIDAVEASSRPALLDRVRRAVGVEPIPVSARTGEGVNGLREAIMRILPEDWGDRSITGDLAKAGDLVLLVMPQDIQAPKGRLILPQVQTLRELLDKKCVIMSVTTDRLDDALAALARPPRLIITDSQAFAAVYARKPAGSRLTSFSILMAGYKGDIDVLREGAEALAHLGPHSRVLIAEACTHAPLAEDIGREKIPAMLRRRFGETLSVDVCSGTDYPADLTPYDLIIHCGGCMFNRKYMLSRMERARAQGVPITNYGVVMAALTGILDKIDVA